MENQIDINDYAYAFERFGALSESTPCPIDKKTGKINPHVSRFKNTEGKFVSVFHVKPVYYETPEGAWRPLYEVTSHHGNRHIVFEYEKLGKVHPRYIEWLRKRCRLIGGDVYVTSPFTENVFQYGSLVSSVHRMVTKPTVGFTTTTVYPDPDPESTTVDGIAWESTTTSSWSTLVNASGDSSDDSGSGASLRAFAFWGDNSNYRQNGRTFVLFDTSSILDDEISSVILSLYVLDKSDPASKSPNADIYTATPASNTSISASDYAQTGSVSQTGSAKTYSSITALAYNDFTFNSTGRGNINRFGVSKFSCKNANYDVAVSAPAVTCGDVYARVYSADQVLTNLDPKLVIEHSAVGNITVFPSTLSAVLTLNGGFASTPEPVLVSTFTIPEYTITAKRTVTTSLGLLTATFSVPVYDLGQNFWGDKYPTVMTSWSDKF